jgi:DNA-binding MarR family transcriptional regulator
LLADLAERILSIAREVNLQTEADNKLIHLTPTEINVMRYIGRRPGIMPKEAARGVGLQRSNFSIALRGLKDRGMVTVVPDEADGRSMRLFPTGVATRNLAHHRLRWANFLRCARSGRLDLPGCLKVLARIDDALAQMRRES